MRAARVLSERPKTGCTARRASFSGRVTYRSLLVVPRRVQAPLGGGEVPSIRASRAADGSASPRTGAMRSMRHSPATPPTKMTGIGDTTITSFLPGRSSEKETERARSAMITDNPGALDKEGAAVRAGGGGG